MDFSLCGVPRANSGAQFRYAKVTLHQFLFEGCRDAEDGQEEQHNATGLTRNQVASSLLPW